MPKQSAMFGGHPARDLQTLAHQIREGRSQRSLALLTAVTSGISGLEVAYEHYRGSYSQRVMYTPVLMSVLLAVAGLAGFFSSRAAKTILRWISALTLVDCAMGFYFHLRGIGRKPGGWRLPMSNIIMGPPVFAPLLFGTSAYLGLIASFLQREEASRGTALGREMLLARLLPAKEGRELLAAEQDIREGRFQRQVAIVTGVSALLSGFEAFYSHYKNNFRYWAQWTPILLAPALAAAAFGWVRAAGLLRPRCQRCQRWLRRTQPSDSTITAAACFDGPVVESIFSTTSCMARRSSPRFYLARRECSAYWRAC